MGAQFVILSAQKPAFGAPCNGCGMCCQEQACRLSQEFLKSEVAPCIALEWDGQQYRCGLLRRPGHYLGVKDWADEYMGSLFAEALGIGKGCCSDTRGVTPAWQ